MSAEFDTEVWLTNRLGERVSTKVRDIVRSLVVDGDWCLDEVTHWKITLVRHDDCDTRQVLDVWLQCKRGGTMGFSHATWWTMVAFEPRMSANRALSFALDSGRRP